MKGEDFCWPPAGAKNLPLIEVDIGYIVPLVRPCPMGTGLSRNPSDRQFWGASSRLLTTAQRTNQGTATMTRPLRVTMGSLSILGILLTPMLVTASGVRAATMATTGNAKTIAFYRTMVEKTRLYGGLVEQQSGFVALKSPTGKPWLISWGEGTPAGYSPASESITIAGRDGKVTWVTDKMTPQCGASVGSSGVTVSCRSYVPVETILDARGKYSTEYFSAGRCWGADSISGTYVDGYAKVGVPFGYSLYGHYLPMKRTGGSEVVTSTFPWGKGTVTEIDTINVTSHLPTKSVDHYSKDGKYPAFTEVIFNHWLKTAPVEPPVAVCS